MPDGIYPFSNRTRQRSIFRRTFNNIPSTNRRIPAIPYPINPLSNRMYDICRKYTHAHLNRARERASGGRKFRSIRTLYAAVKPVKGSPFGRVYHAHPHERAIYRTSVRAREGEMLGARTKVRRRRRTGQEAENTDGHCRGRPLP